MSVKDCPRCGLINPDDAQRCDCGWDFDSNVVREPYSIVELPKQIKQTLIVLSILSLLNFILGVLAGGVPFSLLYIVYNWIYYYGLAKKRSNTARILLGITTFPFTVSLLFSRDVRLYCLQNK